MYVYMKAISAAIVLHIPESLVTALFVSQRAGRQGMTHEQRRKLCTKVHCSALPFYNSLQHKALRHSIQIDSFMLVHNRILAVYGRSCGLRSLMPAADSSWKVCIDHDAENCTEHV